MNAPVRVTAFVDGFNLYHAVDDLGKHEQFIFSEVLYFSAFATWRVDAYKRHRLYVKALRSAGVAPVMGKFKLKDRACFNIALQLLRGAYRDQYDRALLMSGDSDLAPAVRLVRAEFPGKEVRVIAPIGRGYSMDLYNAAGGKEYCRQMKLVHLERSLFGREVFDDGGRERPGRRPP